MNPKLTSKEKLLEISKQIVREEGIAAVSIRAVAQRGGIAVGSVYNYFSSKEELLAGMVEAIWDEIFDVSALDAGKNITALTEEMLDAVEAGKKKYPDFIRIHALSFRPEDAADGKNKMALYFEKIKMILRSSLRGSIKRTWPAHVSADDLADILFNLIISQFFIRVNKKGIIGLAETMTGGEK